MATRGLLDFIETHQFSESWQDLNLSDDDLQDLQNTILQRPYGAPVVPATGGLRKLRFAPPGWRTGKRGGLRVCYVYFQQHGIVLLTLAFAKSEKADLSPEEKKAIRQYIRRQEATLAQRRGSQ